MSHESKDPVQELKTRAGLLLKKIRTASLSPETPGEPPTQPAALRAATLRATQEAALGRVARATRRRNISLGSIQKKHCLDTVAVEFGFDDYRHANEVLSGSSPIEDFGRLLYGRRNNGSLNHWYADYEQAKAHQLAHGGYLLVYRRQFLVVQAAYIRDLGLDPDDRRWSMMGYDWARPAVLQLRTQLYGELIAGRPSEGDTHTPSSLSLVG